MIRLSSTNLATVALMISSYCCCHAVQLVPRQGVTIPACGECPADNCKLIAGKKPSFDMGKPQKYDDTTNVFASNRIQINEIKGTGDNPTDATHIVLDIMTDGTGGALPTGCFVFGVTDTAAVKAPKEQYAILDTTTGDGTCTKAFASSFTTSTVIKAWKIGEGACQK